MTFDLPVPTTNGRVPMEGGRGTTGLPRNRVQIDTTAALFEVAEE